MIRRLLLLPLLLLTACDSSSLLPWVQPQPMAGAQGIVNHGDGQDTPELEARAAEERESLPAPPEPPAADNYFPVGTVPPRPKMPTIAEIAGEANALDAEQKAAMARIAIQAGAPLPETLPKITPSGTAPAQPQPLQPSTQQPQNPAMAGIATMTMSGDNGALLPQSQTIESTDLMRPQDR